MKRRSKNAMSPENERPALFVAELTSCNLPCHRKPHGWHSWNHI